MVPPEAAKGAPSVSSARAAERSSGARALASTKAAGEGAAHLSALRADLDHALAAGRRELAAELRARILGLAEEGPEAAEAAFKLGLHLLFVATRVEAAEEALRAAIRARAEPWSRSARLSLGQLLLRTGRPQQAAFELRKAAGDDPLDLPGVQALAFLADALRALGKAPAAEGLVDRRIRALGRLADGAGVEAALASAWLGFEHKLRGERKAAQAALKAALASAELPPAERAAAQRALDDL